VGQILKLLGFWPPVVYAVVVYSLFWLLDRNAAAPARRALTGWFAGPKYQAQDVANVVLYVFDRVYTTPLFGWRAFLRSTLASILASILVVYQTYPMIFGVAWTSPEMRYQFSTQIAANIVADYLALFVIRRWLIIGGNRPLLALLTAPLIGIVIVIVVYVARDVGGFSIATRSFHWRYFNEDLEEWLYFLRRPGFGSSKLLLYPAIIVHLWLPLFAMGVIVAKGLNYLRTAGRFSQWFFKQGEAHPLRSIGFIASILTFILMAVGLFYWK
jgi:hypothetical protein